MFFLQLFRLLLACPPIPDACTAADDAGPAHPLYTGMVLPGDPDLPEGLPGAAPVHLDRACRLERTEEEEDRVRHLETWTWTRDKRGLPQTFELVRDAPALRIRWEHDERGVLVREDIDELREEATIEGFFPLSTVDGRMESITRFAGVGSRRVVSLIDDGGDGVDDRRILREYDEKGRLVRRVHTGLLRGRACGVREVRTWSDGERTCRAGSTWWKTRGASWEIHDEFGHRKSERTPDKTDLTRDERGRPVRMVVHRDDPLRVAWRYDDAGRLHTLTYFAPHEPSRVLLELRWGYDEAGRVVLQERGAARSRFVTRVRYECGDAVRTR